MRQIYQDDHGTHQTLHLVRDKLNKLQDTAAMLNSSVDSETSSIGFPSVRCSGKSKNDQSDEEDFSDNNSSAPTMTTTDDRSRRRPAADGVASTKFTECNTVATKHHKNIHVGNSKITKSNTLTTLQEAEEKSSVKNFTLDKPQKENNRVYYDQTYLINEHRERNRRDRQNDIENAVSVSVKAPYDSPSQMSYSDSTDASPNQRRHDMGSKRSALGVLDAMHNRTVPSAAGVDRRPKGMIGQVQTQSVSDRLQAEIDTLQHRLDEAAQICNSLDE